MKEHFFNRKISWFNNYYDMEPKEISLGEFLAKGNEFREKIERLRSSNDKQARDSIKSQLPQATISGVFHGSRKADLLVEHSGMICVDIDDKDNPDVPDFDRLKEKLLSNLAEVAYASHSVSGKGYFVIILLRYPKLHKAQFEQLKIEFLDQGLVIDKACSDVCRLRCLSYDDKPYINENADLYTGVYRKPKPLYRPIHRSNFVDDTDEKVFNACQEIKRRHIDMTDNYADWISIGLALASFGENGRDYFHIVSEQNTKYNQRETDRKFDGFLKSNSGRVTIGTFIHFCKRYGIL